MGRPKRAADSGLIYHVLNRGNARMTIFEKDGDYEAFERILEEAIERYGTDVLAWCLMPNHWHLVVKPNNGDGAACGVGIKETRLRNECWLPGLFEGHRIGLSLLIHRRPKMNCRRYEEASSEDVPMVTKSGPIVSLNGWGLRVPYDLAAARRRTADSDTCSAF